MSRQESIAHYRIVSKLGEGGMGEVWRATDTKLSRDVAIKVLPEAFAADPDRLARFAREAQVLASLNHPSIAAIYGVEDRALVLELVEGDEPKGPLSAEEAQSIALQLAGALEYAHERGIIHRDLKPANLKLTAEGNLKVLDFGLAKALSAGSAADNPSTPDSPTMTMSGTMAGVIMGTAAYMSPEQARGQPVDKRADIWAFGVVMYQLLTGKQLFAARNVNDTLAAVLTRDPDLSLVPPRFRRLLRLCLTRDPRKRLRDISAVRLLLDEPEPTAPPVVARPSRLSWLVAGSSLVLAAATTGLLLTRPKPPEPIAARFEVLLPAGASLPNAPSAAEWVPSPDGRNLAMVASQNEHTAIWVRPIGSRVQRRLDKTEDGDYPFWSPDGQFIGFFSDGKLKKVEVATGFVQTVCDLPRDKAFGKTAGDGGTWNRDGVIVFAVFGSQPLYRVPESGGKPVPLTTLNSAENETNHSWPQFLPDGRHVLYLAAAADPEKNSIYVQKMGSDQRTQVIRTLTRAVWAAPGYLLFGRDASLFAQPMDAETLQLKGEPVLIEDDVNMNTITRRSSFAASDNGVLVYRASGTVECELNWVDRSGNHIATAGKKDRYSSVSLSPDGRKAAVVKGPPSETDLWIVDLQTGTWTRGTNDGKVLYAQSVWSPDSRLVYATRGAGRAGILELDPVTGRVRDLTKEPYQLQDMTPDGATLLAIDASYHELWTIPVSADPRAQMLNRTDYKRNLFHLSPDGKWVAYTSVETGAGQVVIASYPSFSEKRQISVNGGTWPRWRADGKELFFLHRNTLMSADIRLTSGIESSVPKELFGSRSSSHFVTYSPAADGNRFLLLDPNEDTSAQPGIMVVLNWAAGFKKP